MTCPKHQRDREYQRRYYADHSEQERQRAQLYRKTHPEVILKHTSSRQAKRKSVKQQLVAAAGGKCRDCGAAFPDYPEVFDFDHLPENGKETAVSHFLAQGAFKKAILEAKKCELVCSNCHRIRTASRLRAENAV